MLSPRSWPSPRITPTPWPAWAWRKWRLGTTKRQWPAFAGLWNCTPQHADALKRLAVLPQNRAATAKSFTTTNDRGPRAPPPGRASISATSLQGSGNATGLSINIAGRSIWQLTVPPHAPREAERHAEREEYKKALPAKGPIWRRAHFNWGRR